jgi:hypothetical protein
MLPDRNLPGPRVPTTRADWRPKLHRDYHHRGYHRDFGLLSLRDREHSLRDLDGNLGGSP